MAEFGENYFQIVFTIKQKKKFLAIVDRNTTAYYYGCKAAQQQYGLRAYAKPIKVAAVAEESSLTGQDALVAGAALSPFAGMIGAQPLRHDPLQGAQMPQFGSMEELARAAQPGDILATSKPSGSVWKSFITPPTGSSFYHIQPVLGRDAQGVGTSATAGEFHDYDGPKSQTITGEETFQKAKPIPEALAQEGYTDAVLLRAKNMTPEQRQRFLEESAERVSRKYDAPHAVKSFFHEMFVPKIESIGSHGAEVICEGNVCSTLPAQAFSEATGGTRKIVPGKPSHMTYPPDFLRSQELEAVGAMVRPQKYMGTAARKAMPWLYRGGVGLGLGGLTYAATEDPAATVAVPAAAALTDLAGTGAARGIAALRGAPNAAEAAETVLPSTVDFAMNFLDDPSARRSKVLNAYFGRKAPLMLLGGLGGMYGLQQLQEHMKSREQTDEGS